MRTKPLNLAACIVALLLFTDATAQWTTITNQLTPYQITRNNVSYFSIDTVGQVWIKSAGTSQQFRLSVDGVIRAREIYVNNDLWADYVFDTTYSLLPLLELEAFIRKNKHLPNIPDSNTVKENQLAIGDTQRLLLEKIEELTLYVIQQQKEIDELKRIVTTH